MAAISPILARGCAASAGDFLQGQVRIQEGLLLFHHVADGTGLEHLSSRVW